ncbi:class I SAM-dependent methyltransferase [Prochlorococcus sp. AH-736-L17]|nr:class I SAM-dependent methyltransferase [Prochlorococcus sp. AH-736-L17]MDA9738433.1 class I SAM-dependent methyltransferase [Prochlorococcus sp. AH-736-L17]
MEKIKKLFSIKYYQRLYGVFSRKYVDDVFISWLLFVNAGMIDHGNIFMFDYVIRNLPSKKPIIEIGSFCGLSLNILNYLLRKYSKDNNLFSADPWIFQGYNQESKIGDSQIEFKEYRNFVLDSFHRNLKFFSNNNLPHTIEATSDKFFEIWDQGKEVKDIFGQVANLGGEISFCYIDGNHEFEFAKKDYLNASRKLEIGGFILFDDSFDGGSFDSVINLMKEVKKDKRFELVMKNPNYLFKKISH